MPVGAKGLLAACDEADSKAEHCEFSQKTGWRMRPKQGAGILLMHAK